MLAIVGRPCSTSDGLATVWRRGAPAPSLEDRLESRLDLGRPARCSQLPWLSVFELPAADVCDLACQLVPVLGPEVSIRRRRYSATTGLIDLLDEHEVSTDDEGVTFDQASQWVRRADEHLELFLAWPVAWASEHLEQHWGAVLLRRADVRSDDRSHRGSHAAYSARHGVRSPSLEDRQLEGRVPRNRW